MLPKIVVVVMAVMVASGVAVGREDVACPTLEEAVVVADVNTAVDAELDAILADLNKSLAGLQSAAMELEWSFIQPLLDSKTIRRGELFYKDIDGRSRLRIDFKTFQQDDERPEAYPETILFDGVWLTRIDYQLKEVKRDQVAPQDKPVGAMDLLTGRMPIIGFGSREELKEQFEISIIERAAKAGEPIRLRLDVREGSRYKDEYTQIDVWVVQGTALPRRIQAVTIEDDINDITLGPKEDQAVADSIFTIAPPRDFSIISKPLKDSPVK